MIGVTSALRRNSSKLVEAGRSQVSGRGANVQHRHVTSPAPSGQSELAQPPRLSEHYDMSTRRGRAVAFWATLGVCVVVGAGVVLRDVAVEW